MISDKSSSAANGLGQESMAHSVTGCMRQQTDFPADAFLSRCYRSSARKENRCASIANTLHMRDK